MRPLNSFSQRVVPGALGDIKYESIDQAVTPAERNFDSLARRYRFKQPLGNRKCVSAIDRCHERDRSDVHGLIDALLDPEFRRK